jgi:small-conductance mechanosensitive channel
MSTLQKIATAVLLVLLAAALYGWWYTSQPERGAGKPAGAQRSAEASVGVDENPFALAQQLAVEADGPDERALAESAERLADHELDLAFAAALRRIEAHPPVLSPEAEQIQERLQKSQQLLDVDQATVKRLTAALAQASDSQKGSLQDQLDVASSQLELDQDEVEQANEELLQAGGNQHQRIQRMRERHAAADQVRSPPATAAAAATATATARQSRGLIGRIRQWLTLRRKQESLVLAGTQATNYATKLTANRQKLAAQLETSKENVPELAQHAHRAKPDSSPSSAPSLTPSPAPTAAPAPAPNATVTAPTALISTARLIAADQKRLTLMDERISDFNQLADIYQKWNTIAAAATIAVLHGILVSATVIVGIILVLLFVDNWMERLLGRTKLDRRQIETLRSVTRVALQIVGVLIIVLIVIGTPSQLGTILGLAGAGLTVALKDFIVAFIGWLVLMGRNGVRLGDWVEINGVSGQVVELGMFHTVLLETGNWADAGHPTGRRVTFTNSFAIERHYFNFSTTGQWLWDELLVLVPYDKDANLIAATIHKEVLAATANSAAQAEQEWRRSSSGRRGTVFSATPGISVKPAVGGVEVAVRYVTRASERFQLRSKLYQSAVQLLGNTPQTRPA